MTTRPLGAQISHMLKDRGVDVIFGIPGVHNQEMYRGIEEAGITHVLARHEQGAGFMADGYARATGRPGVAYVISGPGLCNIMTPMGQAYSDSVPMLVISSCLDETEATRGQLHQMKDQEGAAAAVCDWSVTARTAEAAYALIDRAMMEFKVRRPRPKHLQVPIKSLTEPANSFAEWRSKEKPQRGVFEIRKLPSPIQPTVPLDIVKIIALRIMRAERPLFVFGGGAALAGGVNGPVQSVLKKSRAASFMTYAGRGVVDPSNQLTFGSMLARQASAKIFDASDCVVFVGTDIAEVDLWRAEAGQRPGAIWVNTDAEVLAKAHPKDELLQRDALDFLVALDQMLDGAPRSGWQSDIVAGYCDRWRREVDLERPGILPVADALKAALPANTMIYSDMTQFAYAAKEVYPMDRPGHWHHPYGFGTLGYALPAAIGGKIGVGEQPVVAILGDYGFQYTVQELAVAVELGLTLPIIIWDNGKLGEIEDSMVRAQIAPNAVVQRNPDFLMLARAYGAHAAQPETLTELGPILHEALCADGPTVIRVPADIALTSS